MITWIIREAEKDPALIEFCLQCKRNDCPGECEQFIQRREQIANKLRSTYIKKRKAGSKSSEASALRALITGLNNGAIAWLEKEKRIPMQAAELKSVLQCTQTGANSVCQLYGQYVGKKKFVTRETLLKLLKEVESVGEKDDQT